MVISQLAIIGRRLASKNVYVKKLDIIDELGATTVVATDKTGTLTKNVMILTDLWYNRKFQPSLFVFKIFCSNFLFLAKFENKSKKFPFFFVNFFSKKYVLLLNLSNKI